MRMRPPACPHPRTRGRPGFRRHSRGGAPSAFHSDTRCVRSTCSIGGLIGRVAQPPSIISTATTLKDGKLDSRILVTGENLRRLKSSQSTCCAAGHICGTSTWIRPPSRPHRTRSRARDSMPRTNAMEVATGGRRIDHERRLVEASRHAIEAMRNCMRGDWILRWVYSGKCTRGRRWRQIRHPICPVR